MNNMLKILTKYFDVIFNLNIIQIMKISETIKIIL